MVAAIVVDVAKLATFAGIDAISLLPMRSHDGLFDNHLLLDDDRRAAKIIRAGLGGDDRREKEGSGKKSFFMWGSSCRAQDQMHAWLASYLSSILCIPANSPFPNTTQSTH